jgi:hypothetical protein
MALNSYLDKFPTEKLGEYEQQLSAFVDRKYPEIYKEIVTSGIGLQPGESALTEKAQSKGWNILVQRGG